VGGRGAVIEWSSSAVPMGIVFSSSSSPRKPPADSCASPISVILDDIGNDDRAPEATPSDTSSDSGAPEVVIHLPLTEAKLALDRAKERAARQRELTYKNNETRLHGVTREIDEERRRFYSCNRDDKNSRRDLIYAINELYRQRENRRLEEYAVSMCSDEAQTNALRLPEPDISAVDNRRPTPVVIAEEEERPAPPPSWWHTLAKSLADMVRNDDVRLLSTAELEPLETEAEEVARQEELRAEEAMEAALQAAVDEALEAALEEASCDASAQCILAFHGVPSIKPHTPSEVFAQALARAQKEYDRATSDYNREGAERDKLARCLSREAALKRKLKRALSLQGAASAFARAGQAHGSDVEA